jgi:hypothetical protein
MSKAEVRLQQLVDFVRSVKDNKSKRQPQVHEDEEMFLDFADDYLPIVPFALKELKLIDEYSAQLDEKRDQL